MADNPPGAGRALKNSPTRNPNATTWWASGSAPSIPMWWCSQIRYSISPSRLMTVCASSSTTRGRPVTSQIPVRTPNPRLCSSRTAAPISPVAFVSSNSAGESCWFHGPTRQYRPPQLCTMAGAFERSTV
jgi:hypothetical protein